MTRVGDLRKLADKLSAGDRDGVKFRTKLIMLLVNHPPSEQQVILARVFENITHFSQAEQIALTKVPQEVLDWVSGNR